jgi:hypothetical protein
MSYAKIINFGASAQNSSQHDPITYCALSGLESGFYHTIGGGNQLLGPKSSQCQTYAAQYCAANWDGVCEYLSRDNSIRFPNTNELSYNMMFNSSGLGNGQTQGQILIRNAASEKYIVAMSDNCYRELQPFDPLVPNSVLVGKWKAKNNAQNYVCTPLYDIKAEGIDEDPIMNKLLQQPWIAMDILGGIYKTRLRNGTLDELKGTKLLTFFEENMTKEMLKNLPSARNQPIA